MSDDDDDDDENMLKYFCLFSRQSGSRSPTTRLNQKRLRI